MIKTPKRDPPENVRKSPSKDSIPQIIKNYSGELGSFSYEKDGSQMGTVTKTVEKCHPSYNGYRENLLFCDNVGAPFAKKIIINCIKCEQINKTLYAN